MENLIFSDRANNMPASPIRKLAKYADIAKSKGIGVYHLNIGQPDIHTPDVIFNAMHNYEDKVLRYGPSAGLPELKESISNYFERFNISLLPSQIIVTQGGSEAIIFSMKAICNHRDQILVFEPFYTNYLGFSKMAGVELVPIPTSVENGFRLPSYNEIIKKVTSKTKGIIICSPNNPTGTVYTEDEMELIVKIAEKKNLIILSDEVYREFVFDNKKHVSILDIKNAYKRAVILDSVSKRFSMCGARIGFAATKIPILADIFIRFAQARLCPPTIEQIGALAGYENYDSFMPEMIREYEKRRNVVYDEINNVDKVFTLKPEGAFYCVVKLPIENSDKFSKFMLSEFSSEGQTTMVSPASGFYVTEGKGQNEIRIAYVLEGERLKIAIRLIKKGLEEYKSRYE